MILYKAVGNALETDEGEQVLVMLPVNVTKKRCKEICKITANVLNNIERGKELSHTKDEIEEANACNELYKGTRCK